MYPSIITVEIAEGDSRIDWLNHINRKFVEFELEVIYRQFDENDYKYLCNNMA